MNPENVKNLKQDEFLTASANTVEDTGISSLEQKEISEPVIVDPIAELVSEKILATEKPKKTTKTKTKVAIDSEKTDSLLEAVKPAELELDSEEDVMKIEEEFAHLSREKLTEILEESLKDENLSNIKTKIGIIKGAYNRLLKAEQAILISKFVEGGGKKEDFLQPPDLINDRYKKAFMFYKERKAKLDEVQEKQRIENLAAKHEVLNELKDLINREEALKKTYDEFNALRTKWNEIGQVPPAENNNLWQSYHLYVEKFFDYVKINKELKDLDLRKNLAQKMELCEKAEELLLETNINTAFKKLQDYHEKWREVGPISEDNKTEIWERFKTTTDTLNKIRHDFNERVFAERENNLLAKTALCERIEQINELNFDNTKDWEDRYNELIEIQKRWKTIGFAPKKNNDEIWKRFKTANDLFFQNRGEFYKVKKDERLNNMNLKIDLCVQAEALKENQDWKRTTQEYLRLQEEWKKIGAVPRKLSDKLWKRFRDACDCFFKAKSSYFSNINQFQDENLKKKMELIEKVEGFIQGDNKEDNLTALKDFQRVWMEIGHVPMEQKEATYKKFRVALDKQFEKLQSTTGDKVGYKYKARFEGAQSSSAGNSNASQELVFLQNKANALKSDIAVWENNIGFLSHSKNSDLFRKEFENKIEQAKESLKIMEEKIKYLRSLR